MKHVTTQVVKEQVIREHVVCTANLWTTQPEQKPQTQQRHASSVKNPNPKPVFEGRTLKTRKPLPFTLSLPLVTLRVRPQKSRMYGLHTLDGLAPI